MDNNTIINIQQTILPEIYQNSIIHEKLQLFHNSSGTVYDCTLMRTSRSSSNILSLITTGKIIQEETEKIIEEKIGKK